MVPLSPQVTKNLAGPVKFAPGQVKLNRLNKGGNFVGISGWLTANFSLKHCAKIVIAQPKTQFSG